ncbi:uncharacterized protein F4807DRAFT_462054 [Annulohypoxylon truncatum]|uniref:uncharacterized protein n=1 Tax=Annulohypoxylon truncatum TaxID=327061 RepID=UPI002008144E|nr:uncharacterized protein F4807DRAFT_462054 [Annulohypoxylon truncatum]KAI1207961.1 hypothetical protein F4807DRAFT_462054 [Annulohypoxylon truncatum]
MGNCLSTLRCFFGGRRASEPNEDDVPLGILPQSTSKDNAHNPHLSPAGGDETAFPTGSITIPAREGQESSDSAQSTIVESPNYRVEGDTAPGEASDGDTIAHTNGDAQLPDSENDAEIEHAQIRTARPVSILRVGTARIVSARSAANVRSVTFDLPDQSPGGGGLQQSVTMAEISKAPQQNPNNDPVASYIKKNAETIEAARRKWVDFELDHVRQAQHAQFGQDLTKTKKRPGELYMVPYFDEGDLDAGGKGMLGMGIPTHARVSSELYTKQIRDISGQSLRIATPGQTRQTRSMNQLHDGQNVSPVSPGSAHSALVSPLTPTGTGRWPLRGSSLSPRSGTSNMAYHSDINARRGLARLQEMRPAKRLSIVKERRPQATDEACVPLLGPEGQATENLPESEEEDTEKEQENNEKETEEKKTEEKTDEELMGKALEQVGQTLMKARARIVNKVRKHVEDEMHAAYIAEAILGMADDIVEECAHADNADSQHLIRSNVARIRRVSDVEMKIERVTDADLEYCAESTKKQKAAALVEMWKAQARADVEAKQKGKGKATGVVDDEEWKGAQPGGSEGSIF